MINKKGAKEKFREKGIKIGRKAIERFIKIQEEKIEEDIERIVRNARISGRKIAREEDISP